PVLLASCLNCYRIFQASWRQMLFAQVLTATPSETKKLDSLLARAYSLPSQRDHPGVLLAESVCMPLAIVLPASIAIPLQQSKTHHSRVCAAHEWDAVDVPAGGSIQPRRCVLAQEHVGS